MTIRPVLIAFLIMACLFLLTACFEEQDDGYQFGDISRMTKRELAKLHQASINYCAATSNSLTKKAALLVIQAKLPGYPDDGICTHLKFEPIEPCGLNDDERKQMQTDYDKIRGSPPDPGAR